TENKKEMSASNTKDTAATISNNKNLNQKPITVTSEKLNLTKIKELPKDSFKSVSFSKIEKIEKPKKKFNFKDLFNFRKAEEKKEIKDIFSQLKETIHKDKYRK
ncbi:MAG: hypothetical protein V1824_01120, partial [archaeon]